tara:strand:+ start:1129 stop:1875 length:747 start_codon:yes stop_codon:yes gene_type:complete
MEKNKSSQNRDYVPEPQGITVRNLDVKYQDYSALRCTKYSTNFRDEQFEVFTSFGLDTDGQVFGDSVALQGDSSLSFTIQDKSYVKLKLTLKSKVLKNPNFAGATGFDYVQSLTICLEQGDSFSAGTRKIGMGWEYANLSIIKNGSEQMTSANGLRFLSEVNSLYQFNTFEIKWLESYRCEDIPIIIEDDDDSDFVPQNDDFVEETETKPESEPISDDTLWAILGIIVLIGLCYYLFGGGGNDSVQEN